MDWATYLLAVTLAWLAVLVLWLYVSTEPAWLIRAWEIVSAPIRWVFNQIDRRLSG